MKKPITLMLMAMIALVACNKFDDSVIWDKLNDHEARITYLEETCKKLNTDIVNLQTLVTALESKDYIVSASALVSGDGYVFTFKSGKSIVIYNGKDGVDGKDGKDGIDGEVPVVSVMKDLDDIYYWTVNGEWLLINGKKIKASAVDGVNGKDGVTPQFKIENDYWYVSYDNLITWNQLGKASGSQGDSYFSGVTVNEHFVVFELYDGTKITVPKNSNGDMALELVLLSNVASFSGIVSSNSPDYEVGIIYSYSPEVKVQNSFKLSTYDFSDKGEFNIIIRDLKTYSKIYYRSYVYMNGLYSYSDVKSFETGGAAANSYIISEAGSYGFPTVKGNSTESVGNVVSAEVLWESFGTTKSPAVGDLIKSVSYKNGCVFYETPDIFKEGNAVIAVKDSSGTILWSWHIWLTDNPEECILYNNAGTIMDRNLGATSATAGEVESLGLLYQYGRKDPFLGSASTKGTVSVRSTMVWPEASTETTLDFSIAHPTTFIKGTDKYSYKNGSEWCENSVSWKELKTIYDPCPEGWQISNTLSSGGFSLEWYDSKNQGLGLYDGTIWFPSAGQYSGAGVLEDIGSTGYYWTICQDKVHGFMYFTSSTLDADKYDYISSYDYPPIYRIYRSHARSVRCQKDEN